MAERRINIDKEMVPFLKELTESGSKHKIFVNMAQCMGFAAVYGYKNNKREVVKKAPSGMVDPINYQIFENNEIDNLFILMAMASTKDTKARVLSNDEKSFNERATIFEEYAKGGLKLLQAKIKKHSNYLDHILEIILENIDAKDEENEYVLVRW